MGDFFLSQMEDSFSLGVCFDIRKEGEGGAPGQRSPILRKAARAALAPLFSPGEPSLGLVEYPALLVLHDHATHYMLWFCLFAENPANFCSLIGNPMREYL
jgi:hypothetical protein